MRFPRPRIRRHAAVSRAHRRRGASNRTLGAALLFLALGASLLAVGTIMSVSVPPAEAAAAGDPVLAIGGDIACAPGSSVSSSHCQQSKTGALVTSIKPTVVLPLGDSQYESGSPSEYAGSYDKTGWGALKGISRPAAGNHEYYTSDASGYYGYFGANAGDPSKGYYSYDVVGPNGAFRWHLIALNSECSDVGGCGEGSPQEVWLQNDLAANPNVCTLAYWHRPRFSSSSTTPSSTTYTAFWTDLYNAGADVVLVGHAHDYERFAPQTPAGAADPTGGITQFVVGTGGDGFHAMGSSIANSVVSQNTSFGILKMTLHANGYDWQFMPAAGYTFTDTGTASCHRAPASDSKPPTQPTGLRATAPSANQVNLSWTASTDNVGVRNYNIYRGANGGSRTLLTTTSSNATSYADTSVNAKTPYAYQVQAIDAAGNVSQMSAVASVTTPGTPDTTAPSTPTGLTAEVITGSEIDLAWTRSTDSGTGVSGYRVFRGPAGTTPLTLIATTTGPAPNYQDATASPNTRYDYNVVAFDGAGNTSARSNTVTVATSEGAAVRTYTFSSAGDATVDQASATVNFGADARVTTDDIPVADFLLKFSVNAPACESVRSATLRLTNADGSPQGGDVYTTGSGWSESSVNWNTAPSRGVLLNSLGAVSPGTTYTVDVTNGVTTFNGEVDFRVGSTSSDGARYYSKEGGTPAQMPQLSLTCAANTNDTLDPTAPTGVTATASASDEVEVSWNASTDNVEVTGYRIYRGGNLTSTLAGNALSFRDTTVVPGTTYTYRVTAVDASSNESPRSGPASVTTPPDTTAPTAPVNATATPTRANRVDLLWGASSDNIGVTAYDVYRDGSRLQRVYGSTTTYADTTVITGVTYEYTVVARDAAGNTSAPSNAAAAVTTGPDVVAPTPSANLSATPTGPTGIDLSWNPATDNVNVVAYDIYRDGTKLASIAGGKITYADTSLTPSTTYTYQMKARDAAGNVSVASGTVSARTADDVQAPTTPANVAASAVAATKVKLTWQASTDDVFVTRYEIFRNGTRIATVGGRRTAYVDSTVKASTRYQYTVSARDVAQNVSAASTAAVATTPAQPDRKPPAAPGHVTVTAAGPTRVDLSWTASHDNVGTTMYHVFRNGVLLTSVTGTTASDTTVEGATTYTYKVKAQDAVGNRSVASSTRRVTTPAVQDTQAPSAPRAVTATARRSTRVDLSWTASTDNVGVTGYDVYRDGSLFKSVTDTNAVDWTVQPSSSYSYVVRARDGAGNISAASDAASVTTPAANPSAQTFTFSPAADATIGRAKSTTNHGSGSHLVSDNSSVSDFLLKFNIKTTGCATVTDATLRLTNDADGSVNGGDVYDTSSSWAESSVTWSTAPVRGTLLGSFGLVTSNSSDTVNVKSGVTTLNGAVSFRIGSSNRDRVVYFSKEGGARAQRPLLTVSCSKSSRGADTRAPSVPRNLTATAASSSRVDLRWTASTDNVGVTRYDIYRNGSLLKSVTGTSLTDGTVSASTSYRYVVRAQDGVGNVSDASVARTVATPAAQPSTRTLTFYPTADATIDLAHPLTSYGADPRLITDHSPVNDFLLWFDVDAPACRTITAATLRLVNAEHAPNGGTIYTAATGWNESTVTWNTAPGRGTRVASLGAVTEWSAYTVNVTAGVRATNGAVGFRVSTTAADGARYFSKESSTSPQRPLLTVTCAT